MDCETKHNPTENPATPSKVDLKVCGVCGDKALGYNFNAVTCESCKAFFRRNALKNKEFRCPFKDNCEITLVTRRFCQRCRLEKCLSIGMRKDYIMSEEDKVIKKQKIEQNRARKRPSAEHSMDRYKELDDESHEPYENGVLSALSSLEPAHKVWISALEDGYTGSPVHREVTEPFPSPSVPSPSSPPDSATVAASRTVEMITERISLNSTPVSVITPPIGHSASPPSHVVHLPTVLHCTSPSNLHSLQSITYSTSPSTFSQSPTMPPTSPSNVHSIPPIIHSPHPRSPPNVHSLPPVIHFPEINHLSPPSNMPPIIHSPTLHLSTSGPSKKNDTPLLSSLINNSVKTEEVYGENGASTSPNGAESEQPSTSSYYNSTKNAAAEILRDVQRAQRSPVTPDSIESILTEAIKLEFEAYSSLATSHHNSRELNDAERAKLNELIVANKALHDPLDNDLSMLVGDDGLFKTNVEHSPMLLDVINLTAIAIRRLIKTSKKINAFKNMCQEDQVALLKGGCTEMLILRSAMTYDPDKNSWNIPHTQERLNVKVDVLKEARGNIYEEHQRFLRTFELRWRHDENIMLILGAITLFTPDRPRVVHHDVIKLEQNSYYYLLRRYLESIYQGCEARSTFLKMIQKIAELHRLNDEHIKVYLDVNPRDVEPLLIEIFDLNSAKLRPELKP